MNGDNKSRCFSESLILDDSEKGVVITGITDDTLAARSGLKAGDKISAATIHLDHLNKNEVLKILKVLEPYDSNIKVLTKKQLGASAGLGSFGLGLKDPTKMLNLKKDLSLDASAEAPVVSLDGLRGKLNTAQGLGGELGGPTLNGDLPSFSLNKPSADAGAKFKMPSLGLTGPDVKGDLDGTLKAPNVSVSTPKLNTPSASLDIEKPGIKTGNLKYKAPKFSMPNFNLPQINTPKADMDVSGDFDLPSVSGNLETPNLNLSAPKLDVKSPDLDLNGPKVDLNGPDKTNWPNLKWKGPKVKGPDADFNADLSAPDFNLTTPKIDGDLSAPDVDINFPKADIKSPDLDVQTPNLNGDNDTRSGINWPHFKWKKPKLHGPKADLDLDANLNTPYVDPSLPKVEGVDINLPKAELDMQTPNIDVEPTSGKINWPHRKWKKSKLHGPKADLDIDADLNTPNLNFSTPKIEGDINVPNTELNLPKVDLNSPNVDFQAPDLDIDKKINWPHLKWKKPKLHGPNADVDLTADLSSPDVDLSVPRIDGEISTPDVDLNLPKADIDAGKIRFPTLKKPKFLLSGPKVKSPDVDLDADVKSPDFNLFPKASLDGPDVDMNLPRADVNVKAPNVDIEGQSGNFKWPTIKKPKWSVSGPKIDGPDANLDANVSAPDLSLKAPKIDGEINAPDVNLNLPKADLKGQELDINAPDFDDSGKLKWFNFKKPTFGTLKGPKGNIDADVKVPGMDLKAVDMDLNGLDINPDIHLPKGNVVAPNVGLKASDLNLSAPKMGFDAPDLDIDVPKADLRGPDIDLQTPEVDASAGKLKLPKINLPKFGWSGPRVKEPNLNVDADNVNLPDVNLKLPTADVKAPNLNLSTIKGDLSTPDLDLDADLKTGIDLSAPNTNISVPDLNLSTLNTKGPRVNLNLPKADVTGPRLDLPKADLQVPDLNWKASDLSLSSPKTKAPVTLKAPNMDINLPKADLKGPDAQLKTPDLDIDSHLGDFKFPHLKLPKLGLSSPEFPSVHPSVEAGIKAPEVKTSLDTPELDITAAEADAEVKGSPKSKSRRPFKWGLKSGSVTNEEGSDDDSETDVSNAEVDIAVFKVHKLPRNSIDGMGGIEDILSLSKLDTEAKDYVVSKGIRLPMVNASTKTGGKIDIMERLKKAKEKTHSANDSPTEAKRDNDLKLSAPRLDVSTSTDADSSLVRGGTFKVEKPESVLGLVAPERSPSDENEKLSLSLSNMLGLNIKD
ncbi:neuroblast differentiation-associated protein AHNAK [Anarrhichthys ocellatus]|uniref:neuroblast differentiation-associated protein AHNAK n=1 Tax=Anarrhichthys ocellatus TaxID=433405 RepID=UPI0012EE0B62|nr:neuroblast differentiation-associated protein AHNAK-like [Anarrhichthys ocellatus]